MLIKDIAKLLKGEIICGEECAEVKVGSACASDMMSDVLAFVKNQAMLVTGLCNPQVIRTAEMMDMRCVVFVRGKRPDAIMINLAKSKNIALICTEENMFPACGKLYANGIKG